MLKHIIYNINLNHQNIRNRLETVTNGICHIISRSPNVPSFRTIYRTVTNNKTALCRSLIAPDCHNTSWSITTSRYTTSHLVQLSQAIPPGKSIESICVVDRVFPVAAARTWNSLPQLVTFARPVSVFRGRLKAFLFRRSFLWLHRKFCSACAVTVAIFGHLIVRFYLLMVPTYLRHSATGTILLSVNVSVRLSVRLCVCISMFHSPVSSVRCPSPFSATTSSFASLASTTTSLTGSPTKNARRLVLWCVLALSLSGSSSTQLLRVVLMDGEVATQRRAGRGHTDHSSSLSSVLNLRPVRQYSRKLMAWLTYMSRKQMTLMRRWMDFVSGSDEKAGRQRVKTAYGVVRSSQATDTTTSM